MQEHINNRHKGNSRFFISYEIGVMLGVINNSPVHSELCDRIESMCKNVKLNPYMVAEGYFHYCKEYLMEYDLDEMNELFEEYGLELDEVYLNKN